MPLMVTCSAILGFFAVSTDSGAARFQTVCTKPRLISSAKHKNTTKKR